MRRLLLAAGLGFAVPALFFALVLGAQAHDIYKGVTGQHGNLCCGGEGENADCEPLLPEQIHVGPDGVYLDVKRWPGRVLVWNDRITFGRVPGDGPEIAGHWCGRPRGNPETDKPELAGDTPQPDPHYRTYCAFLNPGGS